MAALIKTTLGQRKKLYLCRNGVGLIAYKSSDNTICEAEFFVDSMGQLCFTSNGTPLHLSVADDDFGNVRGIQIVSRYKDMQ